MSGSRKKHLLETAPREQQQGMSLDIDIVGAVFIQRWVRDGEG